MRRMKQAKSKFVKLFQDDTANQNRIDLLDVKALYDAAYEEKAAARAVLKKFKARLVQAEKLDARYRAQIAADLAALYTSKAV